MVLDLETLKVQDDDVDSLGDHHGPTAWIHVQASNQWYSMQVMQTRLAPGNINTVGYMFESEKGLGCQLASWVIAGRLCYQ